jgi:hypothetical protein
VLLATLALLTSESGAVPRIRTVTVTVAVACAEMLPRVQVMPVVPLHAPCVGVTDTSSTPAGSESLNVAMVASGPLFPTVSV